VDRQDSFEDFIKGLEEPGLVNWADMPTYNTVMALAAGVGLILVALAIREFVQRAAGHEVVINTNGYAAGFAVTGIIQFVTGLHMTLTWPLAAGGFAFDNIIFGETTLAFGTLLLIAAFFMWKKGDELAGAPSPLVAAAHTTKPISIFVGGLGLALFAITLAGLVYQLYTAPPQEPISGFFAPWPMFEAIFLSALFFIVGLGAFLFPIAVYRTSGGKAEAQGGGLWTAIIWLWIVGGVIFGLFGVLNFYSHIGFIVNTQ